MNKHSLRQFEDASRMLFVCSNHAPSAVKLRHLQQYGYRLSFKLAFLTINLILCLIPVRIFRTVLTDVADRPVYIMHTERRLTTVVYFRSDPKTLFNSNPPVPIIGHSNIYGTNRTSPKMY